MLKILPFLGYVTLHANAKGGHSKDTDSMFFAPPYYLHKDADSFSLQATVSYLKTSG